MGQLIQFQSTSDLIAMVDYVAQSGVKSQFLKFNNLDQARQLALSALTRGVDFVEMCLAFDIIGGRLSKKSSAMLAEFRARGGKYKIVSRTPDLASIEYSYDGQVQTFSLPWDQIKDEDYTKEKDGKSYKPRYATPHGRMQMLWARLVSDTVRAIAPECTGGYYTPEEMQDVIDSECVTISANAGALPAPGGLQQSIATQSAAQSTSTIDTTTVQHSQVDVMISQEQQLELANLFTVLGITPEQVTASLASRNVVKVEELTAAQATEIIDKLKSKLASTAGQTAIQSSGPVTQELLARIQEAVKICAQVDGGLVITEAIQTHLQKHGLGMHQLTLAEGERLLSAIEQRQVSLFLEVALNGGQGKA